MHYKSQGAFVEAEIIPESFYIYIGFFFGRVQKDPNRFYRGLAKNTAQLVTLFALSNLWMARRHLLTNAGEAHL